MHPRNRHLAPYDFPSLIRTCPGLAAFIEPHPMGGDTIDFANPDAVTTLNRALLSQFYGVTFWEIPPGYLCPPIPGRADYIHHVADLLAEGNGAVIPRGPAVTALDIGVGANCVYPLIGVAEYGWRFVGADIDAAAIASAQKIAAGNPGLAGLIELRLQRRAPDIFRSVVLPGERFDVSICNPPFHASAAEAAAGTARKIRNLGVGNIEKPVLNFGGRGNELWCDGGEAAFVKRMIAQSAELAESIGWFTTLVSKRGSLPAIYHTLKAVKAADVRTIKMSQGQKQSRTVAWTFLTREQRRTWHATRPRNPATPRPVRP